MTRNLGWLGSVRNLVAHRILMFSVKPCNTSLLRKCCHWVWINIIGNWTQTWSRFRIIIIIIIIITIIIIIIILILILILILIPLLEWELEKTGHYPPRATLLLQRFDPYEGWDGNNAQIFGWTHDFWGNKKYPKSHGFSLSFPEKLIFYGHSPFLDTPKHIKHHILDIFPL